VNWILKNGRVVDPASGRDERADLWVRDGVVAAIGRDVGAADAPAVDCSGRVVVPGLIDMHVHLREPGREDEETIESGSRAAARGGFTAVACMPNTDPPLDSEASVRYVIDRAAAAGICRVHPVGAITRGRQGQALTDLAGLVEAGAVAVSDDGSSVENSHTMRRALEYTRMLGIPVAAHCEDAALSADGVMHEGRVSAVLGLRGIPAESEASRVAREILLAGLTGGHVHIQHVSTALSVELIRRARESNLRVTAEVTPHHLLLTEEALRNYDVEAKVNPPLRTEEDRAALLDGVRTGVIDAIATDHAPHSHEEKEVEIDLAPFGIVGLETAVGLVLTDLVRPGHLGLADAVRLLSDGPARVLRLEAGRLEPGRPADITILDLEETWTVDPAEFESLSRNTPFAGRTLRGRAVGVLMGGRFTQWKGQVGRFGEELPCASSGACR
jgi:dihydroorotase